MRSLDHLQRQVNPDGQVPRRNEAELTAAGIDFRTLLERTGFTIGRNRADCPYCQGHSRLTVSIRENVAFCHRCHWTGNLRTLSRQLALPIAPETIEDRKARQRERAFKEWLDICYRILSGRLRSLARDVGWAHILLEYDAEDELAWDTLAQVYSEEAGIMAALDCLSFEKAGRWLEHPISRDALFAAFEKAVSDGR